MFRDVKHVLTNVVFDVLDRGNCLSSGTLKSVYCQSDTHMAEQSRLQEQLEATHMAGNSRLQEQLEATHMAGKSRLQEQLEATGAEAFSPTQEDGDRSDGEDECALMRDWVEMRDEFVERFGASLSRWKDETQADDMR